METKEQKKALDNNICYLDKKCTRKELLKNIRESASQFYIDSVVDVHGVKKE